MAEFSNFLGSTWASWQGQLFVWGMVLSLLVIAAIAVLRRLRDFTRDDGPDPANMLTNFREMKLQGDISDAEFRTINSLLNVKQTAKVKHTEHDT